MDDPAMPLAGPRVIETASVLWVIEQERLAGRTATDTRRLAGAMADVLSPPRVIEIKAFGGSARGADIPLEPRQVEAARTNPEFWLYVVDNVAQGDPREFGLHIFGGERLRNLLDRLREHRYYTLPIGVAEFDSAPGVSAL